MEPWSANGDGAALTGTRFGDIRYTDQTGSTNADLMKLATEGVAGTVVLLTDHQTAGRGRHERPWFDEPGDSLLVSALLTADRRWADLIPLATGLAVMRAVHELLDGDGGSPLVALKWPNDVLVPDLGDRKLAGILVEATTARGAVADAAPPGQTPLSVVIGMGLNLRWSTRPPDEVQHGAVTLAMMAEWLGRGSLAPTVRDDLLVAYLVALDHVLTDLAGPDGRTVIIDRYRRACATVGRRVTLDSPSGTISGAAEGIGPGGELLVRQEDGSTVAVTAGDAHHLPPLDG